MDQSVFSAVVAMVIATTVITPPALKWSFERFAKTKKPLRREVAENSPHSSIKGMAADETATYE